MRAREPRAQGLLPSTTSIVGQLGMTAAMLLWVAGQWPGIATNDTIDIARQATGAIPTVNWHPPAYTALVSLSYRLFDSPSALVVAQVLVLAWALRRLLDVAVRSGVPPLVAYGFGAILCVLPPVGGLAVHLWKDVPYTVGLLLLIEWSLRAMLRRLDVERAEPTVGQFVLLAAGIAACLLARQNGFLLVLPTAAAIIVTVPTMRRWTAAACAGGLLVVLVTTKVLYPLADVQPPPERNSSALTLLGVLAVAEARPESITPATRRVLDQLAVQSVIAEEFDCHWGGSRLTRRWNASPEVARWGTRELRTLKRQWSAALRSHPDTLVRFHLCASSPAWNPWPAPYERQYFETLYTSVVPNDVGLAPAPLVGRLNTIGDRWITSTTLAAGWQVLLWRSATWMWAVIALTIVVAARRRSVWPLALLTPFVFQAASAMAIAGPHWRYTAGTWVGALAVLPTLVVLAFGRPSQGEDTDRTSVESSTRLR